MEKMDGKIFLKRNRVDLGRINRWFKRRASVWEITTKYCIDRLPESSSIAINAPYWIKKAGFKALNISAEDVQLAKNWDADHRYPFDRMLAA